MKRIDTPDGRFAAGDPTIRKPGTLVTSKFMNDLQDEVCNVIEQAGLTLDVDDQTQLHTAIGNMISSKFLQPSGVVIGTYGSATMVPIITVDETGRITSISEQIIPASLPYANAIPATNIGETIFVKSFGEMQWVQTAYFTGYRSPLCGRPVDGHTVAPLANEIDAVGGLVSKTDYAALWGYAQENALVLSQTEWSDSIGAHWFVDVSDTQFRVPDLRNQFRRYTGTDADTANEREMGSWQADALQNITGKFFARSANGGNYLLLSSMTGAFGLKSISTATGTRVALNAPQTKTEEISFDASRVVRTSTETRGPSVAFHPRIHV